MEDLSPTSSRLVDSTPSSASSSPVETSPDRCGRPASLGASSASRGRILVADRLGSPQRLGLEALPYGQASIRSDLWTLPGPLRRQPRRGGSPRKVSGSSSHGNRRRPLDRTAERLALFDPPHPSSQSRRVRNRRPHQHRPNRRRPRRGSRSAPRHLRPADGLRLRWVERRTSTHCLPFPHYALRSQRRLHGDCPGEGR